MTDLKEEIARASGGYTVEEWQALIDGDDLDQLTVTNARAIAANVLKHERIQKALKLLDEYEAMSLSHSTGGGDVAAD